MSESTGFSIDRFDDLAWRYREGELDDQEVEEFDRLLQNSPEARRRYADQAFLMSALEEELTGESQLNALTDVSKPAHRRTIPRHWIPAMGAAALVCLGLFFLPGRSTKDSGTYEIAAVANEKVDAGVALLVEAMDVEWEEGRREIGETFEPGRIRFKSGTVQLEFYCGALVVLNGEVDLEIVSADRCILHSGVMRAVVPPQARGFQVGSDQLTLIDLGTEFGMRVDRTEGTQVHVFDGLVRLEDGTGRGTAGINREVTEGEALQFSPEGNIQTIPVDVTGFTSIEALAARVKIRTGKTYRRWRGFSDELQKDSSLVAWFPFYKNESEPLHLIEGFIAGEIQTGAVVGSEKVNGRWKHKAALEFRHPSDRVRVSIPGVYRSFTLSAWVRIDRLDNECSSILMSNGWFGEGQIHWQVRKSGEMALAVYTPKKYNVRTMWRSPAVISHSRFVRWQHIAVSYDAGSMKVSHHLNGNEVSAAKIEKAVPVQFGNAEIGNWDAGDDWNGKSKPVRNFNGRIDEIAIFSRSLSGSEIREIFRMGNPGE